MGRFEVRFGRARPLTATEARRVFPELVVLILLGKAQVIFPSTSTPSPSDKVIVRTNPKSSQEVRGISLAGSVSLNWDQWENVMYPLLNGIRTGAWGFLDPNNPLNRRSLCHVGDARRYIDQVGRAVEEFFEQAGYGESDRTST